MLEVLNLLLEGGLVYGICYIINIIGKVVIAVIITKTPRISDDKVKYITKMMSNNIKNNI